VSPATQDDRRFAELSYDDFRRLATDETLSGHEKVGFPDAYREGREQAILADVRAKLPALDAREAVVVDVGAGCAGLSRLLRAHCARHGHALTFVDSPEMLAHHADGPDLTKLPGRFPQDCAQLVERRRGTVDALLAYSVLQYAFADASPFAFLDAALELLAPGGRLLLGDLPNASMRKRFLASDAGAAHHRDYSGRDEDPAPAFNALDAGQLDDGALVGLLLRARAAGFHAWLVPQQDGLPMANRREDLLIARP